MSRRRWRTALTAAATLAVIVVPGGWLVHHFRYELKLFLKKQERLADVRARGHPPTTAFADGRFRKGDRLEDLTARHPPDHTLHHGGFVTVVYIDQNRETYVVSRGGKLVAARLCGNHVFPHTFFDALTRTEWAAWSASWNQGLCERFGLFAVAGFAGANHPNP